MPGATASRDRMAALGVDQSSLDLLGEDAARKRAIDRASNDIVLSPTSHGIGGRRSVRAMSPAAAATHDTPRSESGHSRLSAGYADRRLHRLDGKSVDTETDVDDAVESRYGYSSSRLASLQAKGHTRYGSGNETHRTQGRVGRDEGFPSSVEPLESTTRSREGREYGLGTSGRGRSHLDGSNRWPEEAFEGAAGASDSQLPRGFLSADVMESTMLREKTRRTDQEIVELRRSVARNHNSAQESAGTAAVLQAKVSALELALRQSRHEVEQAIMEADEAKTRAEASRRQEQRW